MQSKLEQAWYVFFGLVLLAGFGSGAYWLARTLWHAFSELDPAIAAPLLTMSATVIVAVITVVAGKQLEQRRDSVNQLRMRKIEVYQQFLKIWFEFLARTTDKTSSPISRKKAERDIAKYLHDFTSKLILWGNHDVIKAFGAFRESSQPEGEEPNPAILVHFEQVLFEMRKDLGHTNKGLKPGALLLLFLSDPANILHLVEATETQVPG